MLPPDPDLPLLHTRSYDVNSYMEAPNRLRLRGIVRDVKPAGLYVPEDPDPLTVHHMVVDLVVEVPSMEIDQTVRGQLPQPGVIRHGSLACEFGQSLLGCDQRLLENVGGIDASLQSLVQADLDHPSQPVAITVQQDFTNQLFC